MDRRFMFMEEMFIGGCLPMHAPGLYTFILPKRSKIVMQSL